MSDLRTDLADSTHDAPAETAPTAEGAASSTMSERPDVSRTDAGEAYEDDERRQSVLEDADRLPSAFEDDARQVSVMDDERLSTVRQDDEQRQQTVVEDLDRLTTVVEDDERQQSVLLDDDRLPTVHEDDVRQLSVLGDVDVDRLQTVREDDDRQQSVREEWDGVPMVTETYTPSGTPGAGGNFESGEGRDRVVHPAGGVGYEFDKSQTDRDTLRDRIESLPPGVQEAMTRGDGNVTVTITASASREGPSDYNQKLSDQRGRDMAEAMRELGVKSAIHVVPVGETGAPDGVDNPADRVATFQVDVTERVPSSSNDETPSPTREDPLKFDVPKTKHEEVSESINDELSDIKPSFKLHETIMAAVKMQWLAAASGYAAGRAEEAKTEMERGFALGLVYGADGRTAERLGDDQWRWEPRRNVMDEARGKIGQNAFNHGLVEGFKQGQKLGEDQRKELWGEVVQELRERREVDHRGDPSDWNRSQWSDWYHEASIAVRQLYLSEGRK